jgi:predicted O-methyltransferase YrrM
VNYIQERGELESCVHSLLKMTRRPPVARGPISDIERLVTTREIGFVEIEYPPKCIARASATTRIGQGNHWIEFVPGEQEMTDEIVCLHAPIRSRRQLDRKADCSRVPRELRHQKKLAWHLRWWESLGAEGRLDEEWAANSHENGSLDVGDVKRLTVYDTTLRDAVAPFVKQAAPPDGTRGESAQNPVLGDWLSQSYVTETLARVETIDGWLDQEHATFLMGLTALALVDRSDDALVEIGSYCGRSTVAIGSAARFVAPEARLFAIDPHEGFVGAGDTPAGVVPTRPTLEEFQRNIAEARLDETVTPIVSLSYDVPWSSPIAMLFIDGLHDYENVSRDYAAFASSVRPGGFVVFDDYDVAFPGVVRFVDERESSGEIVRAGQAGKVIAFQKSIMEAGGRTMADAVDEGEARKQRAAALLRQVLFTEGELRQREIATRDTRIVELQTELFAKVGERDEIIRDLQRQLEAERDARSAGPQQGGGQSVEYEELRNELARIHSTRAWKLLSHYWRLRARLRGGRTAS